MESKDPDQSLALAIRRADITAAISALIMGASDHDTGLALAARHGNTILVLAYLDAGAGDIDVALCAALEGKHPTIAKELKRRGAVCDMTIPDDPMMEDANFVHVAMTTGTKPKRCVASPKTKDESLTKKVNRMSVC